MIALNHKRALVAAGLAGTAVVLTYRYIPCFGIVLLLIAMVAIVLFWSFGVIDLGAGGSYRAILRVGGPVGAAVVAALFITAWGTSAFLLQLDLWRAKRSLPEILQAADRQCPGIHRMYQTGRIDYVVDCGPPVRVAFVRGWIFIDNWKALIHDPSGAVKDISGPMTNPHPLRGHFGGDIIWCEAVGGDFYLCRFT